MGYREVELVLDNGPTPDPLALLMVALASHASANGWCWPGHETLARRTRKTPRQVIRNLKALACAGWLTIHPRSAGEGKRQTAYTLNMTKLGNTRGDAQMSHDIQVSPQSRSDILGGAEVTFEPSRGDILPLPILRNQRTKEPMPADASERVIVYDEYAQAPPSKAKRPELVKHSLVKLAEKVPEEDEVYAEYPEGGKIDPKRTKKSIRAQHALLITGQCGNAADELLPKRSSQEAWLYLVERTKRFAEIRKTQNRVWTPDSATWFNNSRFANDEASWYDKGKSPLVQQASTYVSRSIAEKLAEQRSSTR